MRFVLFFSIAFLVFFSINFLIYRNILVLFNKTESKWIFTGIFFFVSFSYLIYRFSNGYLPHAVTKVLGQMGSLYLGMMVFLFLLFFILNLIQLFIKLFWSKTLYLTISQPDFIRYAILSVIGVSILLTLYGFFNTCYPRVRTFSLTTDKNLKKPLRVVAVSDLHLGDLFFPHHTDDLAERLNALQPDIVLMVGDILSEDVNHMKYNDIGMQFKSICAKYGVYAVPGNHEYIGGIRKSIPWLKAHQIEVLQDSTIIRDHFIIIGRDDLSKNSFTPEKRKSLQELNIPETKELFTIVLDHQPYSKKEALQLPVDLLISGHTHHGQIFPFNLITSAIFDNSWGMQVDNRLHYYVSCGYGFWGPPVRLGNRPEILLFEVREK